MKFFAKCENCKKRSFIIKRRTVNVPQVGIKATSKTELCARCNKYVHQMLTSS